MRFWLRGTAMLLAALATAALAGYRVWFHNPHSFEPLPVESVIRDDTGKGGLLIRNATLIDVVAGKSIPKSQILIRGGDRIEQIASGEALNQLEDVTIYDAGDKFVMPGLIDVHVHLTMHPQPMHGNPSRKDERAVELALQQFVQYGVTAVMVLGGAGANDEQAAELKRRERAGEIVAPMIFATGNMVTVVGGHPVTTIMRLSPDSDPNYLHETAGVTTIRRNDLSSIIDKKKQLGLDGVKIVLESGPPPWHPTPRMTTETAKRIVEIAHEQDLPVYAHAISYDDFLDAMSANVDAVMHSVTYNLIDDRELMQRMKQENTFYVPTLSLFYGFQTLDDPDQLNDHYLQAGVSPRAFRGLEHPMFRFGLKRTFRGHNLSAWLETSKRNLRQLHQNGIKIALGTDAGTPFNFQGYGVHVEMELMGRAGLPTADILRAATINGAEFLRMSGHLGTIESGKIANLLVLRKNPLVDLRHTRTIEAVILKGRVVRNSVRSD